MKKTEHPCLIRARIRAAELGSTATTLSEIVRYLKAQPQGLLQQFGYQTQKEYLGAEKARKSHAEAKRAKRCPEFRKVYLTQLRKCADKTRRCRATTLAGVTAFHDSRPNRIKILQKIARLRSIARGFPTEAGELEDTPGISVAGFDTKLARKYGASINMRGEDAKLYSTKGSSRGKHTPAVPAVKHYGRWVNYEPALHINRVRSLALIDKNPRTLHYAFHQTEVHLELPEGYLWSHDLNGLKVVHGVNDYHPTVADLLKRDAVEFLLRTLTEHAERRASAKAQLAANLAQMQGVYVCLADARRAGNCLSGCQNFAARHQLDLAKHYEAPALLEMANGDADRVRLAITAAILRHKKEMERGYALLSEHTVPHETRD